METLYSSIKDDLLAKIIDGTYSEGQTIPSEVELAKAYGVSRPTIRQALQILVNEGYLDKRKRRGTIVTNPARIPDDRLLPPDEVKLGVQDFEDDYRAAGKTVTTMPILIKQEEAGIEVALALGLEVGAPVYKLVRLRYVDGVPSVFIEGYVPVALYPDLIDVDFSTTRLYARMRELGRPVKSARRRLEAIKADASISTLLDVPVGDPILYLHTYGRDAEGTTVEYSISSYRGRSNSFEFLINDPENTW